MKKLFTLLLLSTAALPIFAEKKTTLGGQIDIYAEYSPIDEVTLSLGEEVSFTNFLEPENGLFDACNTVFGLSYTPHKNVSIEAGYEFLYAGNKNMEHVATLAVTPQASFGDFELYLKETAQMTHSVENGFGETSWQLVSEINLSYSIPDTPLSPSIYVEMTNPLEQKPESWYDTFCYGTGLDWAVNDNNTLGIYYEFSHTIDSYNHLIGIGYTFSF